ncbi:MAG: VOC family virulence protein [Rhodospirillaceae bacterium]|nr:VOC family virulence protein [Rhodospirillaceae bacterium]
MAPTISSLDHIVLTVADIEITCEFYKRTLGFVAETFASGRKALKFGNQKINLHEKGREFEPKAGYATPGSADLCFLTDDPVQEVVAHLASAGVFVIDGPIKRTGAAGPIMSIYFRDPDENLIEVANQL